MGPLSQRGKMELGLQRGEMDSGPRRGEMGLGYPQRLRRIWNPKRENGPKTPEGKREKWTWDPREDRRTQNS